MTFLFLLTLQPVLSAELKVFEKNGKYGLADINSGKIILKAKYDSVYPFIGDYARIRKVNKYGLVDKKGKEYLSCKYEKILFPVAGRISERDLFWVSKDGKSYYLTSNKKSYPSDWSKVFFGPDQIWYGLNSEGKWMKQINDPNGLPVSANFKDNRLRWKILPGKYQLFNDKLYSPKRKPIAQNVIGVDTVRIKGNHFISVTHDSPAQGILVDINSGIIWKKDNADLNGFYHTDTPDCPYLLRVSDDNIYHAYVMIDSPDPIYIIKDLEYDLYSVQTQSKILLPFRFLKILIDKYAGVFDDKPLWKVTLESRRPLFSPDIKDFVNCLNATYQNFIVEIKSCMGRSLFGNTGRELVNNNLVDVYTKDGYLRVKFDGQDQIFSMNGMMPFDRYDKVWQSEKGNLTLNDYIVLKGDKVGLYVDGQGEVIPPMYEGFMRQWGHIFAYVDDMVGLYDDYGNKIIDPKYSYISIGCVYSESNYYFAKNKSGSAVILGDKGQIIIPAGQIDNVDFISGEEGKWCWVFKNGKRGLLNIKAKKLVIPCVYESNFFFGDGHFPNRKVGVYRCVSGGDIVDIWTLSGKKIASRFCPSNTPYINKCWIENQLNVSLYYDTY